MSWNLDFQTDIPKFITQSTRVVYVITIQSNEERESRMRGGSFYTLRTYSEFRLLYKTLLRTTQPSKNFQTGRRCWGDQTKLMHSSCRCQHTMNMESCCPFQSLSTELKQFQFPSKQTCVKSFQHELFTIQKRQSMFCHLLRILRDFFAQFPRTLLDSVCEDGTCVVMNAYKIFLNMDRHLACRQENEKHIKLRTPLRLIGWHRQRGTSEALTEDIVEEGDMLGHLDEMPSVLHAPELKNAINNASGIKSEKSVLPSLHIQPMLVGTAQTMLHEFCDHLLELYGNQFEEYLSTDESSQRRYQISLYIACCIGHIHAVRLLLFYYPDATFALEDGTTCLHVASRMGHAAIVSILLEQGADYNCKNATGITPLIAACRHGKLEAARLLVQAGADISICSSRKTYPLHAAIVSNNMDLVFFIVSSGANVNVITVNGITPLHFAAKLGNIQLCRLLLNKSAAVLSETYDGITAATIAKVNGHHEIHALLQRHAQSHRLKFRWFRKNSNDTAEMELLAVCNG